MYIDISGLRAKSNNHQEKTWQISNREKEWWFQIYEFSYTNFHISKIIIRHLDVYLDPIHWPTPSWLVSSIGRALHRYRRGHGFKFRRGLNFFQVLFTTTRFSSVLSCEDLLISEKEYYWSNEQCLENFPSHVGLFMSVEPPAILACAWTCMRTYWLSIWCCFFCLFYTFFSWFCHLCNFS